MVEMLSAENESDMGLAASVAPEDLRRGDFVAVLSMIYECPSFLWCCDSAVLPRDELVRLQYTGAVDGRILKIKALCLPFVFVKEPAGTHRTLDLRLCRLVRLSPQYARQVWKTMRKKREGSRQ